jgi:hypothetical protein
MKNSNFVTIVFSVLFAGLTASSFVFGQCNPVFTVQRATPLTAVPISPAAGVNPAFVCIDVATTASPEYIVTVAHGSCLTTPSIPTYSVSFAGKIQQTVALSTVGTTSTFRFRSTDAAFCKGRITFTVRYPASSYRCTTSCSPVTSTLIQIPGGSFSSILDVSKRITAWRGIAGPTCVTDTLLTWAVDPRFQCPEDGIGVDPINWQNLTNLTNNGAIERFSSVDQRTARSFNVANFFPPGGSTTISAQVGRCPTPFQLPNLIIRRGAGATWITPSTVSNLNNLTTSGLSQPIAGVVSPACNGISTANGSRENYIIIPINTNATTTQQACTLTANGNGTGVGVGINYLWSLVPDPNNGPVAFSWAQLASTPTGQNPNMRFETNQNLVNGSYNNGTGTFTVSTSSSGCGGNSLATFKVLRYLVQAATQIDPVVTGANVPSRLNYITSGAAPRTCWRTTDAAQTLTLQNAPTGALAKFRWEAPVGWILQPVGGGSDVSGGGSNILTGTNLVSVTLVPGPNAVDNQKLSVRMIYPNYEASPGNVQLCGTNNTVVYPIGANNLRLPNNNGGITVALNNLSFTVGGGQLNTVLGNLGGTPACSLAQFTFRYEFRGKVMNGANVVYDNPNWGCGNGLFAPQTQCSVGSSATGASTVTVNTPLTYSASTVGARAPAFRVVVTSTLCGKNLCYQDTSGIYTVPLNGSPSVSYRMAVDEGGDDFVIAPNPPVNQMAKLIFNKTSKGKVEIFDRTGKSSMVSFIDGKELELFTQSLTKGIYIVRFTGQNSSTVKKLIIQ